MSDGLEVHIKVDPGGAIPKAKAVEESLAKTEAAGDRARKSVGGLTDQLKKLGDAVVRESAAQRRMVEIWEREAVVFNQIRGPAQAYMRDLQTLNNLLARGTISAREFNQQLAAIKPSAGGLPSAMPRGGAGFDAASLAGGLPGGSIIAGAVGGGVAGAATAGAQMAIGGAGQVIAMADAYTGLNNRLKALTGSQSEATALFDKLHVSANKTYSNVNTTTDSFVKFSRALKGLGASQSDTIAFTERLNMVIAMSGASSQGADAAMLQLGQALSSGVLRGEEFNSVIEQAPALLDPIAKHLGVTVGQLRGLAQQGQITSKVIYDSFVEAGPAIEKAFGQSVPTVSQQMQVLKNDIGAMVGELAKSAELSKVTASVLSDLKTVIAATAEQTKLWSQGLNEVGLSFGDLASGGAGGFKALINGFDQLIEGTGRAQSANVKYVDGIQVINRFVAAATGKMNEFAKAQTQNTLELTLGKDAAEAFAKTLEKLSKINTGWDVAKSASGLAAIYGELESVVLNTGRAVDKLGDTQKKHKAELSDEDKLLNRIRGAHYEQSKGLATLSLAYGAGKVTLAEYNEELYRLFSLTGDEGKLFDSIADQMGGISNAIAPMAGVKGLSVDILPGINKDKLNKARTQAWLDELEMYRETARQTGDALQAVFLPLTDSMVDMLYDGTKGWEEWGSAALREIEKAIAKMLVLKLIQYATGGAAGGGGGGDPLGTLATNLLGGGEHGFDYMASGSRVQFPGFQHGFDGVVGGVGRPDSRLAVFGISPGESLHVRTPNQRDAERRDSSSSGTATRVTAQIVVQNDPSEIVGALGSRAGDRAIARFNRKFRRD